MARWPLAARFKNPFPPISDTLDRSNRVLNRGASGVVTILPAKEGAPRGGWGRENRGVTELKLRSSFPVGLDDGGAT